MENQPIIEIKGVGKRYNINHRRGGYIALRDVIMDTLRSPLKFLKRKAREIAGAEIKEEFWALKDVSASINKGEVIGIIGPNGSGKSTLLKILTGITPPTEGEIIMQGKVASLLEVGTGFHPELTGRENIFLNGAIIGMGKKEIAKKFDEIVSFSGVEKFIDTPVKYYSSGMYVRLAFSVAAHMEPDILLVDEVLAVGDAEFQKKCLGKMEEVTKQAGRTILFVSHNMTAIKQLCDKTILLEKGTIKNFGETHKIIEEYVNKPEKKISYLDNGFIDIEQNRGKTYQAKVFKKIRILDTDNLPCEYFKILSPMKIEVELENTEDYPEADYCIAILAPEGQWITSSATWMYGKEKKKNAKRIILEFPTLKFSPGKYKIYLSMTQHNAGVYVDRIDDAAIFHIESGDVFHSGKEFTSDCGVVIPDGEITLI
jgi:lipopolysaccharide transport system ATP-binding protein